MAVHLHRIFSPYLVAKQWIVVQRARTIWAEAITSDRKRDKKLDKSLLRCLNPIVVVTTSAKPSRMRKDCHTSNALWCDSIGLRDPLLEPRYGKEIIDMWIVLPLGGRVEPWRAKFNYFLHNNFLRLLMDFNNTLSIHSLAVNVKSTVILFVRLFIALWIVCY